MFRKKYHIRNFGDDSITPEESLLDGGRKHLEAPITRTVLHFFSYLFLLVIIFFVITGFRLQVIKGADFKQAALDNRSSLYGIPGIRGEILDRGGKALATNRPAFDLVGVTAALPKKSEEVESLIANLSDTLAISQDELRAIFRKGTNQAIFFIKRDVSKEVVLKIGNQAWSGVFIVNSSVRSYALGEKAATVLGYTSKVTDEDMADSYYDNNDRKGRAGAEATYEADLRGEHGRIFFDRVSKNFQLTAPKPGQTLVLNIDQAIQQQLYQTVSNVLRTQGLKYAAAVVQNPNTGEILGLVSFPGYDNNDLVSELSQTDYERYFISPGQPLFNRAISGRYSPGSTIKPLEALSALKEGTITPRTTITDLTGYITVPNIYHPEIEYRFHDFKIRGTVDLKQAITVSSNIYFYSVGGGYGNIVGLGLERLEKYFKLWRIDQPLGIDLPSEGSGFVPTADWKQERTGEPWFIGDTYNISVGQGDLGVTPLWLSSYVSAIANGGTIYRPTVAKSVLDRDQKIVKTFVPEKLVELPYDRATFNIVRDAMRNVVLEGTGKGLKDLPVEIAAKTGTTEVVKYGKTNSSVMLYGPYTNPEIAMSIVIEDTGTRYGLAVNAAHDFLAWYFDPARRQ